MRSPTFTAVCFALLPALAGSPTTVAQDEAVRIESPRHLATAIGPTEIRLQVDVPPGRSLDRVEVRIDDILLATLDGPPWQVAWDAGDGSRGHGIQAIAFFSDGGFARAFARTSSLRINQTLEIDLVNIYALVFDRSGQYVAGLAREDFVVLEDGTKQEISRFATEQLPLRVAIVLDTSQSMSRERRLDSAQQAALNFLEALQPADEALVVAFADRVEVAQDVTTDRPALAAAIGASKAQGGTALYDAIFRTAKRLEKFDGRRVMVLLSDGRDEAANGFEPGSLHTLEEAVNQAVRSEVMVFTIGLGRRLDEEYAREWTRPLETSSGVRGLSLQEILASIAESTGGRMLISPGAGRLRRAFEVVAQDLRNQYSLAYSPSNDAEDGRYRRIEVSVPERNVEVIAKKGYYASSPRDEVAAPAVPREGD